MDTGSLVKPIANYRGLPQTTEEHTADQNKSDSPEPRPKHIVFEVSKKPLQSFRLNDGYLIPAIAFSTSLGHKPNGSRILPPTDHSLARTIQNALEIGYRNIDTAAIYRTESETGLGIQYFLKKKETASRSDLFVTTKLWNDSHERENVIPALEKSLKRLKLDYVDLYLMHYPFAYKKSGDISLTDYLETWKSMEEAKYKKFTRSIGVANFNISQMQRLWDHCTIKPAVLQIEVNPTITQITLVDWCHEHGVVVMGYCPFGAILKRREDSPPVNKQHPTLKYMSKKYKKTVPQILLRYLIDRKIIPVSRSSKKNRMKQNLEIFDFKLTARDVIDMSALNANYRIRIPFKWYPHPLFPFERKNYSEYELKHMINHSSSIED